MLDNVQNTVTSSNKERSFLHNHFIRTNGVCQILSKTKLYSTLCHAERFFNQTHGLIRRSKHHFLHNEHVMCASKSA